MGFIITGVTAFIVTCLAVLTVVFGAMISDTTTASKNLPPMIVMPAVNKGEAVATLENMTVSNIHEGNGQSWHFMIENETNRSVKVLIRHFPNYVFDGEYAPAPHQYGEWIWGIGNKADTIVDPESGIPYDVNNPRSPIELGYNSGGEILGLSMILKPHTTYGIPVGLFLPNKIPTLPSKWKFYLGVTNFGTAGPGVGSVAENAQAVRVIMR
jgi:hypothetical protein